MPELPEVETIARGLNQRIAGDVIESVWLGSKPEPLKSSAAPGAERLEISSANFAKLFRGRKTPIKSALLNQRLLSGVGNIYADEALFRAAIRPRRSAASLTRVELKGLHLALRRVLQQA